MKPVFYECDICGSLHRWEFNGDCREDSERFAPDEIPADAEVRDMDARVAADEAAHNAGARIADDCFCPSCGARGHQFTCPRCSREESGR